MLHDRDGWSHEQASGQLSNATSCKEQARWAHKQLVLQGGSQPAAWTGTSNGCKQATRPNQGSPHLPLPLPQAQWQSLLKIWVTQWLLSPAWCRGAPPGWCWHLVLTKLLGSLLFWSLQCFDTATCANPVSWPGHVPRQSTCWLCEDKA